jgi:hypothetical protein
MIEAGRLNQRGVWLLAGHFWVEAQLWIWVSEEEIKGYYCYMST